jgi:MinD superfamily P-loop ATPase
MPDHPTPPQVPQIDDAACQVCRTCAARKVCRVKAILAIDPGEAPFIDASLCYGCLICIPACPFGAITT